MLEQFQETTRLPRIRGDSWRFLLASLKGRDEGKKLGGRGPCFKLLMGLHAASAITIAFLKPRISN